MCYNTENASPGTHATQEIRFAGSAVSAEIRTICLILVQAESDPMAAVEQPAEFKPKTSADTVLSALRASLFTGAFEPGQAISARRIAEQFDMSVIPARDALRALVAEGVLVFTDSRTIAVPVLDRARFRDIAFARLSLEKELAGRAAAHITAPQLALLHDHDRAVDAAIAANDSLAYVRANHSFHFAIYRMADSPLLTRFVETLWLQYAPTMRKVCGIIGARQLEEDFHRVALEAIGRGDHAAFREAIASDIRQGIDFVAGVELGSGLCGL